MENQAEVILDMSHRILDEAMRLQEVTRQVKLETAALSISATYSAHAVSG